jgi:uncharacterized membrane protein YeaQ/YmgE (transglycosylase-associated protein family)
MVGPTFSRFSTPISAAFTSSSRNKDQRKRRRTMINFIIWIILGAVIGWIASMIMRTDAQQGPLLNIVVGIVGAFLGGLLLAPLFGTGTINQNDFSISGLLVSLLGAIILLAIVNLFRRGSVR